MKKPFSNLKINDQREKTFTDTNKQEKGLEKKERFFLQKLSFVFNCFITKTRVINFVHSYRIFSANLLQH